MYQNHLVLRTFGILLWAATYIRCAGVAVVATIRCVEWRHENGGAVFAYRM